MNRFLKDLEIALKKHKVSLSEINEIIADHREMMDQAIADGLSEEELTLKFGDPEKLARDLSMDAEKADKGEKRMFELITSLEIISEINKVHVQVVSEDLELLPSDGETIEIYYKNISEPENYTYTVEDGVFTFKRINNKTRLFISKKSGTIRILLPEMALNKYSVQTVSGDIIIEKVQTKEFQIKSTSGDAKINDVHSETINLNTVSGDFAIENLIGNQLKVSAVSGDYEVKNVKITDDLDFGTVSGDFELNNVTGKIAILNTVSGDLTGKEFYVEKVNLKSVSGDITIENEDKLRPIEVGTKKSLSGHIRIS
jgi:DUF4097 and DUF4098 domain-containing protein YvlB